MSVKDGGTNSTLSSTNASLRDPISVNFGSDGCKKEGHQVIDVRLDVDLNVF